MKSKFLKLFVLIISQLIFVIYLLYCSFLTGGAGHGIFYPLILFMSPMYPLTFLIIIISGEYGVYVMIIAVVLNIIYWVLITYYVFIKKKHITTCLKMLIINYIIAIISIVIIPGGLSNIELSSVLSHFAFFYFSGFLIYLLNNFFIIYTIIKNIKNGTSSNTL